MSSSRPAAARPASVLVDAAVGAARMAPTARRWCLITGPNLPQADFDAAAAERAGQPRHLPLPQGFPGLLASAELSVSQAGYNTVCDMLQAGCRAHPACRSPPAARPSRRCAPSGCSGWGWPCASPEDALSPALDAASRSLASRSRLARARPGRRRKSARVLRRLESAQRQSRESLACARCLQCCDLRISCSNRPDQHEAGVFLHRQRAGEAQLGEPGQPLEGLERLRRS